MISLQFQLYSVLDTIGELSEAAQINGETEKVQKLEQAATQLEVIIKDLGFPSHIGE